MIEIGKSFLCYDRGYHINVSLPTFLLFYNVSFRIVDVFTIFFLPAANDFRG